MTKFNKELGERLEKGIENTVTGGLFDFEGVDEKIDLSIIVPVYKNVNFTKLALEGLTKLSDRYEIVIVDNGSQDPDPDDTAVVVEELINNTLKGRASVVYMGCPRNMGFGAANNKGYKHSRGRNVMFLNNDIRIEDKFETWPEEMIKLAEEGYIVGTEGGMLDRQFNFNKEGTNLPQSDYWYVSGWCMCGSRETFDKLVLNHYSNSKGEIVEGKAWGPWNEKFFLYFEDGDLTWRAKELGIEFKEVQVPVHHFSRMTGRKYSMFGHFKKSQRIFKKEWKEKYKP